MRLLLMRHANTEISHEKRDVERTLTPIGISEAEKAADFLQKYQIDKIIVSYVKRTMQTASIIQEKINSAELESVTVLYNGIERDIMNLIYDQADKNKHILIIGHNPLIYSLSLELANKDSKEFEFLIHSSMPTARIVVIDFGAMNSWKQVKDKKGDIVEIFTPKSQAA